MKPRGMENAREEAGSRQEAGSLDPADLLRAELMAVEPSPAFAAGVRQRIESGRAPRMVLQWSAVASLSLAAAWALLGPAASRTVVPAAPPVVVSEVAPPSASPASASLPALVTRRRVPKLVAAPVTTASAQADGVPEARLDVLVPPDQAIAVRHMLMLHAAGRQLRVAGDGHAVNWLTGRLMQQRPVEIPLVRIEPLPGAESGAGGKLK